MGKLCGNWRVAHFKRGFWSKKNAKTLKNTHRTPFETAPRYSRFSFKTEQFGALNCVECKNGRIQCKWVEGNERVRYKQKICLCVNVECRFRA